MQSSSSYPNSDRKVLSVSRAASALRAAVEQRFSNIWVEGEISNFKRHSSGHCYFTLKDDDAQLRSVMFRGDARHVSFRPQDGMLVQIYGSASVYEPRGDLQIIVRSMKAAGEGALQKAFEALKKRLADEGLFDRERKRTLPRFPRTIGIVTSGTGAALQDILTILKRRYPCVSVLICPVQVQGIGAAEAVAAAITHFNAIDDPVDVLIVGRGGGSLEDLWAFNEECVARSIFASSIPVISAVGHETDFSIADFVADRRAATPSMAAELAVPDRAELLAALESRRELLQVSAARRLERYRRHVRHLIVTHGFKRPADRLQLYVQKVDALVERLHRCSARMVTSKRTSVEGLRSRLDLLGPERPLDRGYVLVERGTKIIRRAANTKPGDRIVLRFADGRIAAPTGEHVQES